MKHKNSSALLLRNHSIGAFYYKSYIFIIKRIFPASLSRYVVASRCVFSGHYMWVSGAKLDWPINDLTTANPEKQTERAPDKTTGALSAPRSQSLARRACDP